MSAYYTPTSAPGLAEPGDSARLVEAIGESRDSVDGLTIRHLNPLHDPTATPGALDERLIPVDQTNHSVIVGDRAVVKWMRPDAPDRAATMLAHLAAAGFRRMPVPYAIAYRDGHLAAIVTGFLPDAQDGWDWCVDALLAALDGGPPADFAAGIGTLAAELHTALATPTGFVTEPVGVTESPDWAAAALDVLAQTRAVEDDPWFADRVDAFAQDLAPLRDVASATVVQLHGDLHVGQVLQWRDGLAVTDFDGNPVMSGPAREPLARDIAQLRTSLLHVGQIADRRSDGVHRDRILTWGDEAADALLAAYVAGLGDRAGLFDATLLRPFEVEQECRELLYAARFRPSWRYAPLGVLRSWYR